MALGQDVNRLSRVIFNFPSQLIDDNTQIFTLIAVIWSPNGSQQIFVSDGSTSMLHQTTKSLVLFWSEAYLFTLFLHKAAIGVERDVADYADHIWFSNWGMAPPDDCS